MLFSSRDLRKIVIPLILQQALSVTVGMLDSIMVASAGEAAVSGVSLVDNLNLLMIYIFSALASGGAITISQALGAQNHRQAKEGAKQLVWVVFVISLAVMLPAVLFRNPLLNLVFGSISPEIMQNARIYFLITALSYPFLGIYNACSSIFRAAGNSRISLWTSLLMNGVNIVGNALLIYVFHLGAAGAAIATLFSRMVGSAIILYRICRPSAPIRVEKLLHFRPQWPMILQICRIGIPTGIENGMFQFGRVITQSLISTFGSVQIAANAAAGALTSMQYIPGTAIGLAIPVIVGRCIGAGKLDQAKYYSKKLMAIAFISILAISIPMFIFADTFVGLYNLSVPSSELAAQLLQMHCIWVCTIWPLAFTLPNTFRAASDVRYPMVISSISMWVFRVALSFVLGKTFQLGIIGVWISMACDWTFRAVVFVVHYLRGKWYAQFQT